ncbi:membrane protein [Mycolicibacterium cyprinidarum]|nr:membrane protein [Mycolicibacterium sp. NGTWS1803]
MSPFSKSLYTPLATAASIGGGLLAGKIFSEVWKRVGDAEPPDPKDLDQSTSSVYIAAALQGVTWGLVRAAVQRTSAHGFRAVTNESPPT